MHGEAAKAAGHRSGRDDRTPQGGRAEVLRRLLRFHAANPNSRLKTISTELIPWPDYGGGAKYSLFEHSIAVANWIRTEWANAAKEAEAAPG